MNPSERALLREQMTEEELAPWRPFTWEDLKQKMDARIAELTEEEKADTKRCPLEARPKNQKKEDKGNETVVGNGRMFGGPFSEESFSKFVLRKKGYIVKDKQVIPPSSLPETWVFSEETMSRIKLRELGYTFTDEILPEDETGTTAIGCTV